MNGWKGGKVDVGGWRSGWFVGVTVVEGKWVFGDAYCSRPCSQGLVVSVSLAAKHDARRCIDAGMLVGMLTLAVGLGT